MSRPYGPTVASLVEALAGEIHAALGERLLGLYLFGSLVFGDFDDGVSDVDLLAVVGGPPTDAEVVRLAALHSGFVRLHPEWDDRVEVLYADPPTLAALGEGGEVVLISPGEPLHRTAASAHWLTDVYAVRQYGVTLFGLPPAALLPPVSRADFVAAVRANLPQWRDWVHESRTRRHIAYAVLTVCRALYALVHGEQASKAVAARWAAGAHPEWAGLVERALRWRAERSPVEDGAAYAEAVRFVEYAVVQLGNRRTCEV